MPDKKNPGHNSKKEFLSKPVEHIDITGEIDKLLHIVAEAKENMATLRQYYGTN